MYWRKQAPLKDVYTMKSTMKVIPFANIVLDSTQIGTTSDENGRYEIDNIKPGIYNLTCSFVGFKTAYIYEISVGSASTTDINIALTKKAALLDQVMIQTNRIEKSAESPLSKQTIGATEIYRNPGGNQGYFKSNTNSSRCCHNR